MKRKRKSSWASAAELVEVCCEDDLKVKLWRAAEHPTQKLFALPPMLQCVSPPDQRSKRKIGVWLQGRGSTV